MRVDAALYTVSEIRLHGTASYCTAQLSSIMHVSLLETYAMPGSNCTLLCPLILYATYEVT